ncbi:uncharacterized protein LOC133856562 [Alnus glutinosa]|uniref:uncharacterized protein LOC133856562 n=1 Tax=Alnus glutinosa TaxID=3517 RepID=UPI002D79660F|nr:uncharacterized protein LOC133856562 [Alnus glutinosa]
MPTPPECPATPGVKFQLKNGREDHTNGDSPSHESSSSAEDQQKKPKDAPRQEDDKRDDVDGYGEEIESNPKKMSAGTENVGQRIQKPEDININIRISVPTIDSTKMIMTTKVVPPPEDPKNDDKKVGVL